MNFRLIFLLNVLICFISSGKSDAMLLGVQKPLGEINREADSSDSNFWNQERADGWLSYYCSGLEGHKKDASPNKMAHMTYRYNVFAAIILMDIQLHYLPIADLCKQDDQKKIVEYLYYKVLINADFRKDSEQSFRAYLAKTIDTTLKDEKAEAPVWVSSQQVKILMERFVKTYKKPESISYLITEVMVGNKELEKIFTELWKNGGQESHFIVKTLARYLKNELGHDLIKKLSLRIKQGLAS